MMGPLRVELLGSGTSFEEPKSGVHGLALLLAPGDFRLGCNGPFRALTAPSGLSLEAQRLRDAPSFLGLAALLHLDCAPAQERHAPPMDLGGAVALGGMLPDLFSEVAPAARALDAERWLGKLLGTGRRRQHQLR